MKLKSEFMKENNRLASKCNRLTDKDEHLRRQFTDVLFPPRNRNSWDSSGKVDTLQWEEIFFRIGELNSDANYTILLNRKSNLESENFRLNEELDRIKRGDK